MAVSVSGGKIGVNGAAAPVLPLLMVGIGGYLMWFGVKYWRDKTTIWPSDPVKSVLQGKGLPARSTSTTAAAVLTAAETSAAAAQATTAGSGAAAGATGGAAAGQQASGSAQNMAKMLLGSLGWNAAQLPPLISLWNGESGWNPKARNSSSGAFGIAQALGHGQAGTAAPDGTNEYGAQYGLTVAQARQANAGSALQQIRWGMGYIKATYGTPAAAYSAWQARSPHWYARGGYVAPGQTAVAGEAGPEYITPQPGGGVMVSPGAPPSPRQVVSGGAGWGPS
jgi:hypothetical protein